MKTTKRSVRWLALVLAVVLLTVSLTGCKEFLSTTAQKILGTSNNVEEADTTQWAEQTADTVMLEGITDASAKYASAVVNGSLNIVFNGIWSRQTDYFTAPNGVLEVYGYGTAEGGPQKFKVAVWQKVDGGAQYVTSTTYYFRADGLNYHSSIGGLDPNASYRLTISYDSSRYYLYGGLKVEGVA